MLLNVADASTGGGNAGIVARVVPATGRQPAREHEAVITLFTSNRPVENWGKMLGDATAASGILDRLLHHAHVLKCGPRSYRTKAGLHAGEAEA